LPKINQVDHFIPRSRYPIDLGHNLVLAHDRCNNAKSDYLAAEDHLAAWAERNLRAEMDARLTEAELPHDLAATVRVARWVYGQTEEAGGQVWVAKGIMKQLSAGWSQCLGAWAGTPAT
jgi:hypothetical protein